MTAPVACPSAAEKLATRANIASRTSEGGGIESQLAMMLRSRRASTLRARTCGVWSVLLSRWITSSSDRSIRANREGAPPVALATPPSPAVGTTRHRRQDRGKAQPLDIGAVVDAVVEEQPPQGRQANAEQDRDEQPNAQYSQPAE